jgi:tetratricopeptide (TPR) repeat protein
MYKQALEIRQRLAKDNPKAYEPDVASTLYNLAILYIYTQRFTEAEEMFKQALEIQQRLAKGNPSVYEYDVASSLFTLGNLYKDVRRHTEAEEMYKQALEIQQRLAKDNPKAYKPLVAMTLGSQSLNAIFMKKYSEAEQLAREGLAVDSTQDWVSSNLAAALLLQGRYTEAEPIYRQFKEQKDYLLGDFEQFKAAGVIPKEREEDVEKIKRMLEE